MPFVILLDTSQQEEEWIKDALQRSLYHFLSMLGKYHPLEPAALVAMGSPPRVHISFTNDYPTLRSAVYSVVSGGPVSLPDVLQLASKFVLSSIGSNQACHFVLLTACHKLSSSFSGVGIPLSSEQGPSVKSEDREHERGGSQSTALRAIAKLDVMKGDSPFPLKIHSVVLALSLNPQTTSTPDSNCKKRKREESDPKESSSDSMDPIEIAKTLSAQTRGFFRVVEGGKISRPNTDGTASTPTTPNNAKDVTARLKDTFDVLLRSHFRPYQGILCCGHLRTRIHLHPNPYTACIPTLTNTMEDGVSFPSMLSIVGFLPSIRSIALPSSSAHVLLPDPQSPADHLDAPHQPGATSQPQPLRRVNPFCYMLFEALNRESACALVWLGPGWYGVLQPHSERKNTALILVLIPRGMAIPGIGSLDTLVYGKEPNLLLQMHQTFEELIADVLERDHFSISRRRLQEELQTIYDMSLDLPNKADHLVERCDHIRRLAFMYFCPQLLVSAANVLKYVARHHTFSGPQADEWLGLLTLLSKKLREQNLDQTINLMD